MDSLSDALEEAVRAVQSHLATSSDSESEYRLSHGVLPKEMEGTRDSLVASLRTRPDLEIFDGKMRAFGNGWSRVELFALANSLIVRALSVGIERTMDGLNRYLAEDRFPFQQMLLLGGITIEDSRELGNGITLVPFSVDNLEDRRWLPHNSLEESSEAASQISAALVRRELHPRIHSLAGEYSMRPVMPKVWDFSALEDAMLCITCVGQAGPAMIATSLEFAEWRPVRLGPCGQLPYHADFRNIATLSSADLENVADLYQRFTALPDTRRKVLRVALLRLNSARRRRSDIDSAIDLWVALEVLFARGRADAAIGSIVRFRAAKLLKDSLDDRKELDGFLNSLYKLRNGAVHNGEIDPIIGGVASQDLLRRGSEVVATAVTYFIRNVEPDWKDLEFS